MAALVQQSPAACNAGLCQPDAIRKRMAFQASQLMSSVMGYEIQGQCQSVQTWGDSAKSETVRKESQFVGAVLFVLQPTCPVGDGLRSSVENSHALHNRCVLNSGCLFKTKSFSKTRFCCLLAPFQEINMPVIAWLLGVPITVIILLMLFGVF